jgi:hypothetical protein
MFLRLANPVWDAKLAPQFAEDGGPKGGTTKGRAMTVKQVTLVRRVA